MRALEGLSFTVRAGEVVALLGVNGAGKTTALRAIMGLLPYTGGVRDGGTIRFAGESVNGLEPTRRVRRGISMVMEGRRVFGDLTIEENLRAASFTRRRSEYGERARASTDSFRSSGSAAGSWRVCSPVEKQQMLAIGRALMQQPRLLLLDEPSLGLAPLIVEQIKQIILKINRLGTSILLIEQNAAMGPLRLRLCICARGQEGRPRGGGHGAARRQGHPRSVSRHQRRGQALLSPGRLRRRGRTSIVTENIVTGSILALARHRALRRCHRREQGELRHGGRRVLRDHRPERRGQDHVAQRTVGAGEVQWRDLDARRADLLGFGPTTSRAAVSVARSRTSVCSPA